MNIDARIIHSILATNYTVNSQHIKMTTDHDWMRVVSD